MRPYLPFIFLVGVAAVAQQPTSSSIHIGDVITKRGGITVVGSSNRFILGRVGPVHLKRDVRSDGLDRIVKIHAQAVGYLAVLDANQALPPDLHIDAETDQLLSPKQLMALDDLLSFLKRYVESLVDLNEGTSSYSLDDAVAAERVNNIDFGGLHFSQLEKVKSAIHYLAFYLADTKKSKSQLEAYVGSLDWSINELCNQLRTELDFLRVSADRDFYAAQEGERLLLEHTTSPEARYQHVRNLPILAQAANEVRNHLQRLMDSIRKISDAHRSMSAALSHDLRSVTFRAEILELLAPAQDL